MGSFLSVNSTRGKTIPTMELVEGAFDLLISTITGSRLAFAEVQPGNLPRNKENATSRNRKKTVPTAVSVLSAP